MLSGFRARVYPKLLQEFSLFHPELSERFAKLFPIPELSARITRAPKTLSTLVEKNLDYFRKL